jgi:L-ribulose-5-phosphate 4-epimerase
VAADYETETGQQILDCFRDRDPLATPMVLVAGHGPFTWGVSPAQAVYHAVVLEELARMAFVTMAVRAGAERLPDYLIRKHFQRKHGTDAYYGQDSR